MGDNLHQNCTIQMQGRTESEILCAETTPLNASAEASGSNHTEPPTIPLVEVFDPSSALVHSAIKTFSVEEDAGSTSAAEVSQGIPVTAPDVDTQESSSTKLGSLPSQTQADIAVDPHSVVETAPFSKHREIAPFQFPLSPISISHNDPIWGDDAEEFWKHLGDRMRAGREQNAYAPGEVGALARELRVRLSEPQPKLFAFDQFRQSDEGFVNVTAELEPNKVLWFIGDLHGDWLSLLTLSEYIEQQSKRDAQTPIFFFLGDLFDDGPFGAQVLADVIRRIIEGPERVGFVVGNHDEALQQIDGRFVSEVRPAEFSEWLNTNAPIGSEWYELASAAIEMFQKAPRAILLPNGLLAAHGGVPHTDLHANMNLNDDGCLRDFVWTRLHDTAKRKIPNRSARGCSLGIEDFHAFCKKAESLLGRRIEGLIRGHDHVRDRWQVFDRYTPSAVLTINAMSYRQRDLFGSFERRPVTVRIAAGEMPTIHQIEIPAKLIHDTYYSVSPATPASLGNPPLS